jgi:UDP-N-acetylmuramyl pentapeptide phosphotransferase/UDP-N-acetylglucosamine-1-phosphate transferase
MYVITQNLLYFAGPFLIAWAALYVALRLDLSSKLLDVPNDRSLHSRPKPRIGGIGIILGLGITLVAHTLLFGHLSSAGVAFLVAYTGLFLISLTDDWRSLSALTRLLLQISVIATWTIVCLFSKNLQWWLLLLIILGLCWGANLYNFMDGTDGLAGFMAVIGFAAYAVVSFVAKDSTIFILSASICSATAAFLTFNIPPSRIFLGDCGSIPLGFSAGALGILGVSNGTWHWAFPLLVFCMFSFDSTYTLLSRILRRKKFWQGHNEHFYQKAIRAGNSHTKVLTIHVVCNTIISVFAVNSELPLTTFDSELLLPTIALALLLTSGFAFWAEKSFAKSP